jgi:hypothetical protein
MESIFWFVAAGKSYRIFRMTDTRFINEYIYVYVLSFQIVLHEWKVWLVLLGWFRKTCSNMFCVCCSDNLAGQIRCSVHKSALRRNLFWKDSKGKRSSSKEKCVCERERERERFRCGFLFFNLNIIIYKAQRFFSFSGKRVNKLGVFTFFKLTIVRVNGFKGKQ